MYSARFLLELEDIAVRRLSALVYPSVVRRTLADKQEMAATRRRRGYTARDMDDYKRRMLARASAPGDGPWLDSVKGDDGRAVLVLSEVADGRFHMTVDALRQDRVIGEAPA